MATHTHTDGTVLETRVSVEDPGSYSLEVWARVGEPYTMDRMDDLNGVWMLGQGGEQVGLFATKAQAEAAAAKRAATEYLG